MSRMRTLRLRHYKSLTPGPAHSKHSANGWLWIMVAFPPKNLCSLLGPGASPGSEFPCSDLSSHLREHFFLSTISEWFMLKWIYLFYYNELTYATTVCCILSKYLLNKQMKNCDFWVWRGPTFWRTNNWNLELTHLIVHEHLQVIRQCFHKAI